MKKITALLVAFVVLLSTLSVTASAVATVSVSDASGAAEENITIALSFKGTGKLSAVSVDIEFDSTALTYMGFSKGSGLTADYFAAVLVEDGLIRLSFTDSKEDYTALGPVGYINFKITSSVYGNSAVRVLQKNGTLFDSDYIELEYTSENGTVTVLPGFPSSELEVSAGLVYLEKGMTVSELSALMPASVKVDSQGGVIGTACALIYEGCRFYTVLRGDTNGDGRISTADYLTIKAYLSGVTAPSYPCLAASDTDGNGEHNLTDALNLKKILSQTADSY